MYTSEVFGQTADNSGMSSTLPIRKLLLSVLLCASILVIAGCSSDASWSHPVLTSLKINPSAISGNISEAIPISVVGTYSDGSTRTLVAVHLVLDSPIAEMQGSSTLVCKSSGTAELTGRVVFVKASALVTCAAKATPTLPTSPTLPSSPSVPPSATLTDLTITPIPVSLALTGSMQLHALGSFSDGTSADVTSAVTWSTSTQISSITNKGAITCSALGSDKAVALLSGRTASSPVTCAQPNPQLKLNLPGTQTPVGHTITVSLSASYGQSISDVTSVAEWTVSPAAYATVVNGTITCLRAGPITLTANYAQVSTSTGYTCAPTNYTLPTQFSDTDDEFVGPFSNWINAQQFGAKGDGVSDDSQALQAAIKQANPYNGGIKLVYLPAGTYRITSTLAIKQYQFFTLVGADPATTKLLWDGPPGSPMTDLDGSSTFKISRLSFDGGGNASSAIDISNASNGLYTTKVELSDLFLTGTPIGIDLKHSAETTVERVFFGSNSQYGIFEEDWNDINVFIQDSLFYYCGIGIGNGPGGAGSFSARNNFFIHSLVSDMMIQNTGAITARNNTSIGSGAFFNALVEGGNNAELVLQGNTVLDPQNTPVVLGNTGPLVMLDNVFRTTMPVLTAFDNSTTPSVAMVFGNLYTTATPFGSFAGQITEYDDSVADASSIATPSVPNTVYTPPQTKRQIFEVQPGSTDAAIQQAINSAADSKSVRPVVHIPVGSYPVSHSLVIPEGSDLQLVGDDVQSSLLSWVGGAQGAVLSVPSTAKIADLTISNQNGQKEELEQPLDGIRIGLNDQPATRLLADQLLLQGGNLRSVFSDQIEHATVDLSSTYTQGSVTGIAATGGAFRRNNQATLGRFDYVSGSIQSQPQSTSLDVADGGSLVVQDNWHDVDGSGPLNFNLSGTGRVTEQGGSVYTTSPTPFQLNNFQGDVTLMGLLVNGGFSISGATDQTNLLAVGLAGTSANFQPTNLQGGTVASFLNGYYNSIYLQLTPSATTSNLTWLRRMLGQVRAETTVPAGANPIADVIRIKRVQVLGMSNAIHLTPKQQTSELALTISNATGSLNAPPSGCVSLSQASGAQAAEWILLPGEEGDYFLTTKGSPGNVAGVLATTDGGWMIVMEPLGADYGQHWNLQTDAQGHVLFYNRGTGQLLSAINSSGCVSLSAGLPTSAEQWVVSAY